MAVGPCHSLEEHASSGRGISHRLRFTQSHPSFRGDSNALVDPLPDYPKQKGPCTSFNDCIHVSAASTGQNRDGVADSKSPIESGKRPNSGSPRASVDPVQKITLPRTPEKRPRRCFSAGALGHAPRVPLCPDRFIPERQFSDPSASPFRVSKPPQDLSPEEKLLRRRDRREDPFRSPRSPRVISFPRHTDYHQRRHSPHFTPHLVNDPALSRHDDLLETSPMFRQISTGAVWNVGGPSIVTGSRPLGIPDGMGGFSRSGTTAPMHVAKFFDRTSPPEQYKMHESRLALALDIDLASRMLSFWRLPAQPDFKFSPSSPRYEQCCPLTWKDNAWKRAERAEGSNTASKAVHPVLPVVPFRILDAPLLRNDFYCSILAYCYTSDLLAVGLCSNVFLWSEAHGLEYPPFPDQPIENYITSLSFSSTEGGRSILAVGRQSGQVCLWSTFEDAVRFETTHPTPVSCVAFKQVTSRRQSTRFPGIEVSMEDLAVGDECGYVWYYSVEWPDYGPEESDDWDGTMTLLAKIAAHKQQICGLAWSPDGIYLATGGNDNACLLFDLGEVLRPHQDTVLEDSHSTAYPSFFGFQPPRALSRLAISARLGRYFGRFPRSISGRPSTPRSPSVPSSAAVITADTGSVSSGGGQTIFVAWNRQKHRLRHCAAVKAIAFAPWQPSLLATGGGSNDRSIHFYHAPSGSCLATIDVSAQVTSLIWSKTRREIAATFGFAQPEHPFRIAVFAWPSCEQVAAIPWNINVSGIWDPETDNNIDCGRALWAISHPGGPNKFLSGALRHERVDDRDVLPVSNVDSVGAAAGGTSAPLVNSGTTTIRHGSINSMISATAQGRGKKNRAWSRTAEEGCIVVAASDESIRFYQVWSDSTRNIVKASGLLGHSAILEGLEGIESPGREVIR